MSQADSVEKQIFDVLKTDLKKITVTNHYQNDIGDVEGRAVQATNDSLKLPAIGYIIGNSVMNQLTRGPGMGEYTTDLLIDCIYEAKDGEDKLYNQKQSLIDDIKKHFRKDASVTQASWSSIYNIKQVVNNVVIGNVTSVVVNNIFKATDSKSLKGRLLFI